MPKFNHFYLLNHTNKSDFELKSGGRRWLSFTNRSVKETMTHKFAICSSLVEILGSVCFRPSYTHRLLICVHSRALLYHSWLPPRTQLRVRTFEPHSKLTSCWNFQHGLLMRYFHETVLKDGLVARSLCEYAYSINRTDVCTNQT